MCLWLPVVVVSGVGRGVVVGQRAGRLVIFTSEPGSPSQQALISLGFWATSPEQTTARNRPSEDHTA
jgi:hypothetical protein